MPFSLQQPKSLIPLYFPCRIFLTFLQECKPGNPSDVSELDVDFGMGCKPSCNGQGSCITVESVSSVLLKITYFMILLISHSQHLRLIMAVKWERKARRLTKSNLTLSRDNVTGNMSAMLLLPTGCFGYTNPEYHVPIKMGKK